ncbi:biotin transporter BioY [Mobilicoccus massiliensis]|uniref:biotin transporter BioY n=1 Tax=Mobilicoccus massiliensis TaxID=1522310 RepID=UPI0009E20A48|nr:biotin transporter BioY [Mobilicoccus massiliensis]
MPTTSRTDTSPVQRTSKPRVAARDLALIAAMAALIIVLGIPGSLYPVGPAVPITLQSLGVMLAGALLGWKRGGLAVLLFLAVGATGLPVLAGGRAVLPALASPTVGFILGYLLGAMAVGALVQMRARRLTTAWLAFSILVGGIVVVHAFGIPGMMWRGHLDLTKAFVTDMVFMPGDLIKAVVATVVAAAVHRALPTLLPSTWAGRRP